MARLPRRLLRKLSVGVTEEVGAKFAALALKKAGTRISGKVLTGSPHWKAAFVHVAEHFGPQAGKASHAIFEAALRSQRALETLIQSAALKPSLKYLGRETIGGMAVGRPVIVLEREFGRVIGKIGQDNCTVLRLVLDITGKPITAYPIRSLGQSLGDILKYLE
ncbi:MAG: hypothetical protein AABZ53_05655 [Planctomycetota bacterium]